jgi:hypothetical protein
MARKRRDNKRWRSRPSRKSSRRKKSCNQKPCQVRKNNSKISRSTKPSRQRRKKIVQEKDLSSPSVSLDTTITEEIFDARIVHNFLSERYEGFICNILLQ